MDTDWSVFDRSHSRDLFGHTMGRFLWRACDALSSLLPSLMAGSAESQAAKEAAELRQTLMPEGSQNLPSEQPGEPDPDPPSVSDGAPGVAQVQSQRNRNEEASKEAAEEDILRLVEEVKREVKGQHEHNHGGGAGGGGGEGSKEEGSATPGLNQQPPGSVEPEQQQQQEQQSGAASDGSNAAKAEGGQSVGDEGSRSQQGQGSQAGAGRRLLTRARLQRSQ